MSSAGPSGYVMPFDGDGPTDDEERLRTLFEGVWNGADPSVADELVAPEYVIHDRDLAEELRGPDLYRALAEATRELFPDAAFTVDDTVAAGEKVALRWTMTGTHEGSVVGEEPTGRSIKLAAIEIDRFEDGQLVETWTQTDVLGLLEQVGAMPVTE